MGPISLPSLDQLHFLYRYSDLSKIELPVLRPKLNIYNPGQPLQQMIRKVTPKLKSMHTLELICRGFFFNIAACLVFFRELGNKKNKTKHPNLARLAS